MNQAVETGIYPVVPTIELTVRYENRCWNGKLCLQPTTIQARPIEIDLAQWICMFSFEQIAPFPSTTLYYMCTIYMLNLHIFRTALTLKALKNVAINRCFYCYETKSPLGWMAAFRHCGLLIDPFLLHKTDYFADLISSTVMQSGSDHLCQRTSKRRKQTNTRCVQDLWL